MHRIVTTVVVNRQQRFWFFFVFIFFCSCQLGWKGNDWFIANLNRFFKAANLRQEFCHRIWRNENKCNLDNRCFLLSWRISFWGTFWIVVLVFSVMSYKSQLKLDKRLWEFLHVNKTQEALLIQLNEELISLNYLLFMEKSLSKYLSFQFGLNLKC